MADLRAAVIGSGFGGLAAAIRLATAGVRVTVYEARDLPGGRAYVYRDQGFTFDAGPTVITAPHCIDELFSEAGRRREDYCELLPVAPFYRLEWQDGVRFDYDGNREHMIAQIAALRPDDVAGYEAFATYARKVFDAGYTGLASTPFLRFSDMLRVAPQLAMLRADRSVYKTVAKYVKDEHLREALSFHSLLVGGNPFDTSSIYTLIHHLEREWGVWFPRGGTGALVASLCKLLGELGGELRLSSPVSSIRVEAGKHVVTTAAGEDTFDFVVSNADVHHTYAKLYAGAPAAAKRTRKLERMDWSMSLYVLYFGTDRTYAGDLAHHTVVFGPRYRGLLADIFDRGDGTLPEDFSLYLHAPHVTDPRSRRRAAAASTCWRPSHTSGTHRSTGTRSAPRTATGPRRARASAARSPQAHRRPPRADAVRIRARARRVPGLGVLRRPDADPERVLPAEQQGPEDPRALPGRRGNPPGGRRARGDQRREGDVPLHRGGFRARDRRPAVARTGPELAS